MKYAFMTFSCPDLTLDEVLDLAKKSGYDGIEPRLAADHQHGIEIEADENTRRQIKDRVASSGVELACIATSCIFANPATQLENVETARKTIDLAGDVGCPTIRVFGGQIPEGISRPQATNLVAASLGQLAGHAADRGVTVCMETHDDWCDPGHVAEVMTRVDSPAVAVNWDIMHPVRMQCAGMTEAYESLSPWIRHVHVHDARVDDDGTYTLDFVPIGEGYVDHKTAIGVLRNAGYGGFLSGEWIKWSDPYESHLPRELDTLRGYES